MDELRLPIDVPGRYAGRVVMLTGVGRSGTSILGKLVGSMAPTFYLFEPAIMKLLPALSVLDRRGERAYGSVLRAVLFEDYILQMVHGRSLNFNSRDDSCVDNYMSREDIEYRWKILRRRGDAIDYFEQSGAKIIIKTPEFMPLLESINVIFDGVKVINITRNGNDVVTSSVSRGWYTDDYMVEKIVDWTIGRGESGCSAPWYLDDVMQGEFIRWNSETRAAAVWRNLTERAMATIAERRHEVMDIRYEDLVSDPSGTIDKVGCFIGAAPTRLTRKHIEAVEGFETRRYPVVIDKIQEPERDRYRELMYKLGYGDSLG